MHSVQSAWIFNLALRVAAIVCLGVLAVGLIFEVEPLTALGRGVVAFVVFLVLGWCVSAIWDVAVQPMDETGASRAAAPTTPEEMDNPATATPDESPARA